MSFLSGFKSFAKDRAASIFPPTPPPPPPVVEPVLGREDKILHAINRQGVGIEIGPSHRPIAPRSKGFNVTIIDHLDKEGLIAKYTPHGLDTSQIEEVDLIWNGESYLELTKKPHYYDWVIACHLIEHTPDLIGFLQQCEDVLNDQGCLSLAVPDKRYCFDYVRPKSGLAAIIDAHHQKRTIHSQGTAAEYFMNVVAKNGAIAWDPATTEGSYRYVHTRQEALDAMRRVREDKEYLDLHAWTFTPHSFRLILNDLFELGFTKLRERCFFDTVGHEFYITLSLDGHGPAMSRMDLALIAREEGY